MSYLAIITVRKEFAVDTSNIIRKLSTKEKAEKYIEIEKNKQILKGNEYIEAEVQESKFPGFDIEAEAEVDGTTQVCDYSYGPCKTKEQNEMYSEGFGW